jgi:putative transposase
VEDGIYFVTTCLHGSIPAHGLLDIQNYRQGLASRPRPSEIDEDEWELRQQKLVFARFDRWIDAQPAIRWLENPDAAAIVRDALYFFAGDRHDLLAYVVMPSHFHWVFHPRREWYEGAAWRTGMSPREHIMKSIKGFTARQCNKLLARTGTFWQDESWDHVVRNAEELERIIGYVENNPVVAGLTDVPDRWLWSSAHDREIRSIAPGEFLLR